MAILVDAQLASQLVTLYAAQAVDALQPAFVLGSLVNTAYDSNPGTVGNTVNVPIPVAPSVFTMTNLAEGSSITPQAPAISTVSIVVNKHQVVSFQIPDALQAFTNVNVFSLYAKPALIALATQMENDLFALYTSMTSNAAVGVSATTLTDAVVDLAETELFAAYVPPTEPKFLVVSPTAYSGLRQIPSYISKYIYGPDADALTTGELGSIKGFKVFRSQLVPKPVSTTYNLAFGRDAMALVTRNLGTVPQGFGAVSASVNYGGFSLRCVMSYDPNTLVIRGTWDVLYGVQALRPSFGVQVLS
jgi:hypothetical protein